MAEYHNEARQAERRQALKADCYFNRAQIEIGSELGGRFSHLTKTVVTGVPQVPKQPENSPFHHDRCGQEPPLGYSVNDMVPVGTPSEVQASIAAELQRAIEAGSKVERVPDVGEPPLKRRG
jgi:hypothetical protein